MFQKIFNPDNALMITMSQITDCIFLSMFWILGCFPVVTAGASCAALYDAAFRAYRKGDKHSWHRFWKTFRGSWKEGILPTLIVIAASYGLLRCLIAVWNAAVYGAISWTIFSAGALLIVTVFGILCVMFPMISRFQNTLASLLKNTVVLALANMPLTIALGIVNAATALLCLRFIIPLFFLPALSALISSLLIEPMFKPYMNDENAAA